MIFTTFFSTVRKLLDLMRKGYGSVAKWKCWLCLGNETVGISLLLNTLLCFLMILYWDTFFYTFYNETRKQKKKGTPSEQKECWLQGQWTQPFRGLVHPFGQVSPLWARRMDFKGPSILNSQDQYPDGFHPRPSKLLQITLWIYCPPVNLFCLTHQLLNQGKTFFKSSNSGFTKSQILTLFGSFLFITTLVSES